MHAIESVAKFMQLGGQTVPGSVDYSITPRETANFAERIEEELSELYDSFLADWDYDGLSKDVDVVEAVDAAIDIAYVAFTLAIRLAGVDKAVEVWEAVAGANLSKVDGSLGPVRRDGSGKIMKPEGFVHPDIKGILLAD